MKRLYAVPEARGSGVGKALIDKVLDVAVEIGYREMKLDTLPRMESAIRLYEKLGFVRIPQYYDTPLADTVFMGRTL